MKLRSVLAVAALAALSAGCGDQQGDKTAAGGAKSPAAKTAGDSGVIPVVPGEGGKGSDLDPGPVATPLKAMWSIKEKVKFMEIDRPMRFYKELFGHFPKSPEEFAAKIIQQNGIQWPAEFIYDPEAAAKMSEYDSNNPPFVRKSGAN